MRVVPLLLACAALAACGSGVDSVASTRAAAPAPASPPATATTQAEATSTSGPPTATSRTSAAPASTSTSPPAGPSTTAAPAANGLCTAADLGLSVLSSQGASGHGVLALALRNVSARSCHSYGFPGVLFLGPGGQALPTQPSHVTSDFVGHVPASVIDLEPGQSASFRLVVSHGAAAPSMCATAVALAIIAPDDTQTLRTTLPGGVSECRLVTVSPLQSGLSANPA